MEEEWKDFYSYQVSNHGQVRNSKTGRLLKPQLNEKGYLRVALRIDGKTKWYRVSRLVADLFIPNPDNLPEVNHKDENKLNNQADNLEWCDRNYNSTYSMGKKIKCLETGEIYCSLRDASRKLGIPISTISYTLDGRLKNAKNYHFVYV